MAMSVRLLYTTLALTVTLSVLLVSLTSPTESTTILNSHDKIIHRSFKENQNDLTSMIRSKRSTRRLYNIIIDSGSTGSRAWIYSWSQGSSVIPDIATEGMLKVTPALHTLAQNDSEIRNHVVKLIEFAKQNISSDDYADTPIYLFATGGVRMLEESQANHVMDVVYQTVTDKSVCPFKVYDRQSVRGLSGEEEAVFMWIAVNQLTGTLVNDDSKSFGILDLGGYSTQIAFKPSGVLLADKFVVCVGGKRFQLYAHSYLGLGEDLLIQIVQQNLLSKYSNATTIDNPCMVRGDNVSTSNSRMFMGAGNDTLCLSLLKEIIYKDPDCLPKPCAVGSNYQPSIPADMTFYALSAFLYVLSDMAALQQNGVINFPAVQQKAADFCSRNISELKTLYPAINQKYMSADCLVSVYVSLLMVDGYGFQSTTSKIQAIGDIGGKSFDWTLGALIYERFESPVQTSSSATLNAHVVIVCFLNILASAAIRII